MLNQLINKYEEALERNYKIWGEDKFKYHILEREVYQEILQDLKQLKEKVAEELYGQMLSESEHKGACERLIGNNDTPIKEIGEQ